MTEIPYQETSSRLCTPAILPCNMSLPANGRCLGELSVNTLKLPGFSAGTQPGDGALSARALVTPEPFVRLFARRVQQEGALDLTQGDYKNADFSPHPEVVRAAQRITRNTVHSYGPATGRMDVRSEVTEFFNRDGLLDYPDYEVIVIDDARLFGSVGS